MPPLRPVRRRRRGLAAPGAPLPLPLVSTVGVNNLTATAVNLIGSVNPQGLAGNTWFVWGTTPQFGFISTPTSVTATSIPQTETLAISGLTTGTQYWFAIVASTAAGTITSAPLTFVPSAPLLVTDAANVPAATGFPSVTVPHWQFPVSLSLTTGIAAVEQDSLEEIFSNVQAIAVCQQGACPELPTFGVPELTFAQTPLDASSLVNAIEAQEPRATETVVSEASGDPDAGNWLLNLTTQATGISQ